MLSIIKSAALLGIDSYPVEVEVDLSNGLPAFDIVGLPDSAVKESRGILPALVALGGAAVLGRKPRAS